MRKSGLVIFFLLLCLRLHAASFALKADYVIENSWRSGYQVLVTVRNTGTTKTDTWKANFNLPEGHKISNLWNGVLKTNGQKITVFNPTWTGGNVIAPGAETTFGMIVQRSNSTDPALIGLTATANANDPVPPPVQPPAAPALKAITLSGSSYTVSWAAVTNATSYILEEATDSSFSNAKIVSSSSSTTYSVSNASSGTYYYRVKASNSGGASGYSNVQSVTVGGQPLPLPAAPTLNAIAPNGSSYTVSWNASTGASSYVLEEATNSSFTNSKVVFTGSGTSYSVTNAAAGTYYYRVKASNSAGSSGYSNVQSVTVSSTPVPVPAAPQLKAITVSGSSYTVSWAAVTGATSYVLEQATNSSFTNAQVVSAGTATSYVVNNAAAGTYYYRVRAVNASGSSANSNVQSVTVNTPPPSTSGPIVEGYWESWNSWTIPYQTIANMKTDVINISFGTFTSTGSHTYVVSGVEGETSSITGMVSAAHALGKKVKIAIGGISYPIKQMLQTDQDAVGMAAAVLKYIQQYNLDGVDYDIEDFTPAPMEIALLKRTREALGNNYTITYTPMSPASTTEPFATTIKSAHQYVDGINIMAYNYGPGYTYQGDVANLISMGVPASKIVVGLMPGSDDVGKFTSVANIQTAANFVKQNGLRGIMFWSLDRDHDNRTTLGVDAATNAAYAILH